MLVPPPLSLYVHLPWCVRKCPYCDFNSHAAAGALPERDYVAALLRDLEGERPLLADGTVQSIFLGGGTPSLFSGEAIAVLLSGIRERMAVAAHAEVTLEANPGTAEAARFAAYRAAGVNRLSIGVQSFRDGQLAGLGRVHTAGEAQAALRMARAAGFANVNLDLMYGLPGDEEGGALFDLEQALALAPEQVSWYQLTLEPGTAFGRQPPPLPAEERIIGMEEGGRALLARAGYEQYEVSAYARAGYRCRHNLNYWQFGDYLGIGAGAHGKLTRVDGAIERRAKQRNPRSYMRTAGTAAAVTVERLGDARQIAVEFMMNALRLNEGVPPALFRERTGLAFALLRPAVDRAVGLGLLEADPDRLAPTARGLQVLNDLIALFGQCPAEDQAAELRRVG